MNEAPNHCGEHARVVLSGPKKEGEDVGSCPSVRAGDEREKESGRERRRRGRRGKK